ncbi:MAG TPA: nitronate monooxygenase [Casimicrobiaceae bacterium]|nr:nitronate monooxygenase [Casimicrobiaceae bacterium]
MMTLRELLGIELPIIQAPMAGVQASALAIAVSSAGGLGSLPCALLSADGVAQEIGKIRTATSRPFNVNYFCHTEPPIEPKREAEWRDELAPYYREFGIDPWSIKPGPGRASFDAAAADVLDNMKPSIISFHFGLPADALLARARAIGARILASATTVDEARWLEARGVDAIIAQGLEAGGHRGNFLTDDLSTQVGTLALVPQIVRTVRVPVIAAGGIADAKAVNAMLSLGAIAVQIGTAFLLCPEATTSALHRKALASDSARHTAVTNVFTGRPARGIVNRIVREIGPISAKAPAFPLATAALAPLRAEAERRGLGDFSPLWSGQNASGCREIPAAQRVRELAGI